MASRLPKLTEAQFTRQVLELAKVFGWRTMHQRPARTAKGWRTAVQGDGVGWPDLVLVRGGRLIFAELKVGNRGLTPMQAVWLDALDRVGADVYVWRPENWDLIERTLRP